MRLKIRFDRKFWKFLRTWVYKQQGRPSLEELTQPSSLRCPFMSLWTGSIVSRASATKGHACIQSFRPRNTAQQFHTPKLEQSIPAPSVRSNADCMPLRSACVCAGAGQITGRNGGSALRRVRILPRQRADTRHLCVPKASGTQGPAVWRWREFGPGGLATGLEFYRPIIYRMCLSLFSISI